MSDNQKKAQTFQRKEQRVEDLHLILSEKYMHYKDLADRCLINTQNIMQGDKRVFYLKPQSIFLEEPRVQNQFRNDFVKMISTPPGPEPPTLFADDLHRDLLQQIQDRSCPSLTKDELSQFFKRRQYKLQHKKYKLLQRWAHYALTSELVDKVSLKFSPNYSKLQFELENSVKRYQRLEGDDHFLNAQRPQTNIKPDGGMAYKDGEIQPLSALRIDDIDVYLRYVTYEEKINKEAEKFIQRIKWVPLTHRYAIYEDSIDYFQVSRNISITSQKDRIKAIEDKGSELIATKKYGQQGLKDLQIIIQSLHVSKLEKKQSKLRDKYMGSCKYNYEVPQLLQWNQIELKLNLSQKSAYFNIKGDLEIDNGHSFAYTVMVFFPTCFHSQVIKSQFAQYDAVPSQIDPSTLYKKDLKQVLERNRRRYGKTAVTNTLLELINIKKNEQEYKTEFINSIEKAIFGEFNNGQLKDFPSVRVKTSSWIAYECYQPQLQQEQIYQATLLSGENNTIDECLKLMLDMLNIQDVQSVNIMLDSLSSIHFDKVKYGHIKTEFILQNLNNELSVAAGEEQVFTENQKNFLSVFKGCLKTKQDFATANINEGDQTAENGEPPKITHVDLSKHHLLELPQHLLFSLYMIQYLKARDQKIKLLYTLNVFRAIQKRLTLDLREMGSRDRIMGDCKIVHMQDSDQMFGSDQQQNEKGPSQREDTAESKLTGKSQISEEQSALMIAKQKIMQDKELKQKEEEGESVDYINAPLVDIHMYRYNGKFRNKMFSTCPTLPNFHSTFGEPVDRLEATQEQEASKNSDNKKEEGNKLLGRVDNIIFNAKHDVYLVKDDFGVNLMFDASLLDMVAIEQELLRICSFYISRQENTTGMGSSKAEQDLKNMYPTIDRFELLDQATQMELKYQNAKADLVLTYLECYEHISDLLEQQRMIQFIVDLMAQRPKLNLNSTHFLDSYLAEIENLKLQNEIMREVIRMQMKSEFEQNNFVREYLERTYKLIMDQIDGKWNYQKPEMLNTEVKQRENFQKGMMDQQQLEENKETGASPTKNDQDQDKQVVESGTVGGGEAAMRRKSSQAEQLVSDMETKPKIFSDKYSDPKQFALYLGIPFSSLEMLMKDHKERDPLLQQSIHEHVSFIKIEEGYPIFIYDLAAKLNNTIKLTSNSERIGILDFYDSLQVITKIIAAMNGAFNEVLEVHKPDNGMMITALQIATFKYIHAELKMVKGETSNFSLTNPALTGMDYIEDDTIIGNPEKMMFYTKEFATSMDDSQSSHNPYVMTRLNLKTIEQFQFDSFQKSVQEEKEQIGILEDRHDIAKKRKLTVNHAYRFFPKLRVRAQKVFIPSMLYLTCNSIEVLRLRHILVKTMTQTKILEGVYEKQVQLMRKDGKIYFKDPFNFENFIKNDGLLNFVDDGPATGIDIELAINEFDPSLRSNLNFSDPEAFKILICPMGLEELRTTVYYEVMNLQVLIVATRTNQILLDNLMRQLSELEFIMRGYTVANPVFDLSSKLVGTNLVDYNLKKMALSEKSQVNSVIQNKIGDIYYNVIARKNRSKQFIEKHFQKARLSLIEEPNQKTEIVLRQLKTYRMILCQDYCQDILAETYGDAIKLQLLNECDYARKRAYLMPSESMILHLSKELHGEHFFYYYKDQSNLIQDPSKLKFYDRKNHKINGYWRLPTHKEIMKIKVHPENIIKQNMPNIYQFEAKKQNKKMVPDLLKNNQFKIIQRRAPKYQILDPKDYDSVIKDKQRLVEFKDAYNYDSCLVFQYQKYFKAVTNLFDLEFFQSKIASNAFTIATIEKHVLSGLPFWDDGDDALFDELRQESDDENPAAHQKESVIKDLGYANNLAAKVINKMALEKKQKFTLLQDLECIKDKFNELQMVMNKLELFNDVEKAAEYLNLQGQIAFNGILYCLGQVQDKYYKDGNGLKEISYINDTIGKLSHLDDIKVTYTQGFHINRALTKSTNLDENPLQQNFSDFFKAAQPIIDESALSPPQFTIIQGIYLPDTINLRTFKKNQVYMGSIAPSDYNSLNYALINLFQPVRKYIQTNFSSIDTMLRDYVKAKTNMDESVFLSNYNQYMDVIQDKKQFLRQIIKARQLKRIMIIILSKSTVPIDIQQYQEIQAKYIEDIGWKINVKVDQKNQQRLENAEKDRQRQNKLKAGEINAATIVGSLKKPANQSTNILQTLEQAQCEIETLQSEVQKFLINESFNMINKETIALAKAFELNGKHLEYFIHPCQQYASTLNQNTDKRHHLEIINKVSSAQKFLTQLKNRCLEIETLTSGTGIVISSKDLNECLDEICRSIVKQGEIEMRSRCEFLSMQYSQLESLLYIKDRQLVNMEEKLKHAKEEINKIINTKVFSKGNSMIYEMDFTSRQLRLMKDNVFTLEHKLSDKIKLSFERELNQTRMELDETRKKFVDYSNNVNSRIMADVRDNCNNIDQVMKTKADQFKDLTRATNVHNTTININNITFKQSSIGGISGVQGEEIVSYKTSQNNDFLKQCEKEAREEIIKLQEYIRKLRLMSRMKEVLIKQKYEYKIDNLKQQQTSNACLWEQLAEADRRESILKQELERSQQEIATQQKIIERMKDELKRENLEKQKLIQYKQSKSKRLEELEGKAREFEVLATLNLPKVLTMLETKEDKIQDYKKKEQVFDAQLQQIHRVKNNEISRLHQKIQSEVKVKSDALSKMESIRHEVQIIEGTDSSVLNKWKEKCRQLIDVCKNFKEENDKLSIQVSVLQSDNAKQYNQESNQQMAFEDENLAYQGIQKNNKQLNEGAKKRHNSQKPLQSIYESSQSSSTRFKLKKDDFNQSITEANVTLEQPYQNQKLNMSSVLAGDNTAGWPNQSHTSQDSKTISLPKITKKTQQLQFMRGSKTNEYSVIEGKATNIFSNKAYRDERNTPPKTPIKQGEQESHNSSQWGGKLTPMYEAGLKQGNYKNHYGIKQTNDNVFSSLSKPAGNVSFQNSAPRDQMGLQTYHNAVASNSFRMFNSQEQDMNQQQRTIDELQQVKISPFMMAGQSNQLNQSRNMNIMSGSNSVGGVVKSYINMSDQQTQAQNNNSQNYVHGIGGTVDNMPHKDKGEIRINSKTNERANSNNQIKSKMVSPPRALNKEQENQGMKGSFVKKKSSQKDETNA